MNHNLGPWFATALIIPNPLQCSLFRSCGFGILPLNRHDYSDALAVRIFSKNTLGKFLPFFRFLNPNLGKCKNSQLEYFCPRRGPLQLEYF